MNSKIYGKKKSTVAMVTRPEQNFFSCSKVYLFLAGLKLCDIKNFVYYTYGLYAYAAHTAAVHSLEPTILAKFAEAALFMCWQFSMLYCSWGGRSSCWIQRLLWLYLYGGHYSSLYIGSLLLAPLYIGLLAKLFVLKD